MRRQDEENTKHIEHPCEGMQKIQVSRSICNEKNLTCQNVQVFINHSFFDEKSKMININTYIL